MRVDSASVVLRKMTTRAMSVSDLQQQIEELVNIVERQSRQAEEAAGQIAALQALAAAPRASTSASAQAVPEVQANNTTFPRIPDLIRLVPEFDGNPRNLPRWIDSVEEKLNETKACVAQNEHARLVPIWLGVIRDKIKDKANDALSANHTPLEWDKIKSTLIEYFGDKTNLSILVSRMTNLKQGAQSVLEFYQNCRSLLTEINAKILLNNTPIEAKAIMGTYDTLMINAFIDGLHDVTSDLTRSTRPQSLADAYNVASEHETALRRRRERKQVDVLKKPPPNINNNIPRPYGFMPAVPYRPNFIQTQQNKSFVPNQFNQQRPFMPYLPKPVNHALPGPSRPALPYIKPDPSGQVKQNFSNQVVPYRRPNQVNIHEDFPYAEYLYEEDNSDVTATDPADEPQEELNFCEATNKQEEE